MKLIDNTFKLVGTIGYYGHKTIKSTKNIPSIKDSFQSMGDKISTGYTMAMIKDKRSDFNKDLRKDIEEVAEKCVQLEMNI